MNFLLPKIEAKLSEMLGSEVRFRKLKVSPHAGALIAENMTVAGPSPGRPILTVQRITAKIAIAKALRGQIAIKEMLIESPELFLDSKIPRPKSSSPPSGSFPAETIRVENGKLTWQSGDFVTTAEEINAEFRQEGGGIGFTASIAEFARLGRAQVNGQIATDDLARLFDSPASADLHFEPGLHISLKFSRLSDPRPFVSIEGPLDIPKILSALSPNV
jgi:uncharacterized protein involved in outer membrane biogenesis